MRSLSLWNRSRVSRCSLASQVRLRIEDLESRIVPYVVSGNLWPNPQLVTISFMPDGTSLGNVNSNLFSTFNAKFGSAATWQNVILKAAQTWAQQTNLNFAVVSDSGASSGSGSYQQGDPTMGDIRIGGYNYNDSTLASAFMPPSVNNYSIAGDISFNTGQTFNINGQNYDLFTVAMHEFGHALGLEHSTQLGAVMYASYSSPESHLTNDDINGIRNVYSNNNPRSTDSFGSLNNSFTNAANINSYINSTSLTALVSTMDITTAGEKDYYTATAPTGTGSTVAISVQSQGLSLLAPTLTVYAADQITVLGSASGYGKYGTTLTVNLTNKIAANQVFYVKVAGADTTALGTGAYGLTMSFAGNPLPTVPLPNTQVANGSPLSGGGGIALSTTGDDPHVDTFPAVEAGKTPTGTFTPQVVRFVNAAATAVSLPPMTSLVRTGVLGAYSLEMTAPVAQTWTVIPMGHLAMNSAASLKEFDLFGSDGATTLPAALPADRMDTTDPMQPEASRDLSQRDACFADDSWLLATDSGAVAEAAGADGATLALNPAARVAALALVLGGSWAVRTERADRNTRTGTNLPHRPRTR